MRKLLVVLILLLIALVITDRVAVAGAEREIARQVASRYDLREQPEVDIRGIPFLTQAVGGRYEEIGVKMGEMTREGVKISRLDATLSGVKAPLSELMNEGGTTDIRAERVNGTVLIAKETIEKRAPKGLSVSGSGDNLVLSGNFAVLGQNVPITATMKVGVVAGLVQVTATKVELGSGLSLPFPKDRLTFVVPVKNLPLSLKITSVKTTPQGLEVSAVATDVPLRG